MPDTAQLPSASSKRRRVVDKETTKSGPQVPRVFSPFRAIGIVANHVPPAIQVRGKSYIVTTSVGKSFQTYDVSPEILF
jgi:U3 small nucleolar RNA-associated protein 21